MYASLSLRRFEDFDPRPLGVPRLLRQGPLKDIMFVIVIIICSSSSSSNHISISISISYVYIYIYTYVFEDFDPCPVGVPRLLRQGRE